MKSLNLLTDKWLKVEDKNGDVTIQSIEELVSNRDSNKKLNFGRIEFDYAGMQFLISVFQFLLAPKDIDELKSFMKNFPNDRFQKNLDEYKSSFYLFGDTPFMQDYTLKSKLNKGLPIESLTIDSFLIDGASQEKKGKNQQYICSPLRTIKKVCQCCSSLSLMSRIWIGAGGGEGYRQGLSGEGPVIMIIKSNISLLDDILLNLVSHEQLLELNNCSNNIQNTSANFPWLEKLDFSYPEDGQDLTKERKKELKQNGGVIEVNILEKGVYYVYWAGGQRLLLNEPQVEDFCEICGNHDWVVDSYKKFPNGPKHDKSIFSHPLIPRKKIIDKNDKEEKEGGGVKKIKYIPENINKKSYFYDEWNSLLNRDKNSLNVNNYIKFFHSYRNYDKADITLHGAYLQNSITKSFICQIFPFVMFKSEYSDDKISIFKDYVGKLSQQSHHHFLLFKKYIILSLLPKEYDQNKEITTIEEEIYRWWSLSQHIFVKYAREISILVDNEADSSVIEQLGDSYEQEIRNFSIKYFESFLSIACSEWVFYKEFSQFNRDIRSKDGK